MSNEEYSSTMKYEIIWLEWHHIVQSGIFFQRYLRIYKKIVGKQVSSNSVKFE